MDPSHLTAEIDSNLQAGAKIWSVLQAVWARMRLRSEEAEATRVARDILGMATRQEVAYRHASVHSDFTAAAPHPDNLDALRTAAALDLVSARRERRLRLVDRSNVIAIEKSMVLIGSPTAEALSRDLFGYRPAQGLKDGLQLVDSPVDVPFRWVLDPDAIDPGALAARYVRGQGPALRPNWRIRDERNGHLYIPRVDNNGWLSTDFLLVTRVRNFITRAAWQRGSFIVSVGGAHGTGTRAIELLLRDQGVLRQIRERLADDQAAYQLLLEVGKMTHRPAEGTRAHSIRVIAAERLEDREERWSEASRIAFPGFKPWFYRDPDEDSPTLL